MVSLEEVQMMNRRHWLAAASAPLWGGAWAQSFPSRPVRLIVPFPAGGATDLVARSLAEPLGRVLGQPVVVENRSGAGGSVGMAEVAKAAADGHTLGLATGSTHGANSALYKQLPYDPVKDFTPVSQLVVTPNVLLAHPSAPARDFRELLRYLKANPGKITYASPGQGSLGHLGMELLKLSTNTFMVHIPYRGAAPAKNDLLGGQVHLMLDNLPSSMAQIRSGQLRALAVSAPERLPELPQVPTFSELSLFTNNEQSWFGLVAPAGLPAPTLRTLHRAVAGVLADRNFVASAQRLGLTPAASQPEEFGAQIAKSVATSQRVARFAGLKPE
jgi:tripartite-type tricarboxylate transporter receptor subunit TctC